MPDQYPPDVRELRELTCDTTVVPAGTVLWRIHFTEAAYTIPWSHLRTWGPVRSARWDPHPLPEGEYAPLGAAYLGEDVSTCLAEVFQLTRFVDVDRDAPYVTGFRSPRDLTLADLTGTWLLRAGGSAQIALQQKERTRAWARAIHEAWPDLDGLVAPSAMAGGRRVIALWSDSGMPDSPEISVPLNHPAVVADIAAGALEIGYRANILI